MNTLLWKEYRQNRPFLVAAGIFLAIPYLFVVILGLAERLKYGPVPAENWIQNFYVASITSLCIVVLLCAFVAGVAVAGERVDRSAEFLAYLPISRRSAIVSKAVFSMGVCFTIWLVNSVIFYVCSRASLYGRDTAPIVLSFAISAVVVFGISWLFSALLSRATTAAGCGLFVVTILLMVMGMMDDKPTFHGEAFARWYALVSLLLGVGCFIAGTVYYLRRVEP